MTLKSSDNFGKITNVIIKLKIKLPMVIIKYFFLNFFIFPLYSFLKKGNKSLEKTPKKIPENFKIISKIKNSALNILLGLEPF